MSAFELPMSVGPQMRQPSQAELDEAKAEQNKARDEQRRVMALEFATRVTPEGITPIALVAYSTTLYEFIKRGR